MAWNRRAFIGGAAGAAGLSLVPGTAFARIEREKTYGVIEIRASAMSVSVYRFDLANVAPSERLSGFQRMAPQLTGKPFPESERPSPLGPEADDARAAQSVDIVVEYIEALKSLYGLQTPDIAVLVSSGLADSAPERVARFTAGLRERTGLAAEVITIHEQSRLAYDWIVAPARRNSVLHIDISAGYTKGGYYDRRNRSGEFFDLAAGYGTKSMAGDVKRRWPEVRTADFGPRSAEFYRDTVEPVLAPQIVAAPLAAQRPQLCLTGGIVWASTVILEPEAIARQQTWIDLAPDHFAKLLRLIESGTPYGGPLPASLSDAERERVRAALEEVRKTYNPHQLAAGAAIGDGLSRQLRFDERERLFFAGFASFAGNVWSAQYLIEKFS
ncbi:MAG TPA: hypothetical protein VI168_06305 [Croceibacterium sp.]